MTIRSPTRFAAIVSFTVGLCAIIRGDPLDHWTIRQPENAFGGNFSSIAYGSGTFVATASDGGDDGWLGYSADGLHWKSAKCAADSCVPPALFGTAFANGRFVAVGNYGWTYTSTTGVDWRLNVVPPSDSLLWDVCYAESNFVAVGGMDSCPCGFVAVSPDGEQWSPNYVDGILSLRAVAYGSGILVAVGTSEFGVTPTRFDIFSTTNPLTPWTAHAAATTNDLFGVAYGNNLFVAAGEEHYSGQGCVLTSADGNGWSRRRLPETNALRSVSWIGGLFIATGKSGALLISTNGIDWRVRASGTPNSLGRSVYGKGAVWIADAEGTLLESDPLLSLRIAVGQQPELTVFGLEGRACRIEATSDLGASDWSEVGNFILYSSPTIWRDGITPVPKARLYRAMLLP